MSIQNAVTIGIYRPPVTSKFPRRKKRVYRGTDSKTGIAAFYYISQGQHVRISPIEVASWRHVGS